MAAPLVQRVELDAASAQRQLSLLERQLATLNNPINVPVDVDVDGTQRAEKQMADLRREVDQTGDEFTEMGRKADASSDGILRVGTRGASAFTSLRGSIIGVGAAIAAIQGVRLLGGFAADAIQSASNLQESLSKTNVVFEDFSGEIQDFAKDAPRALGLSTAAALESTSTFGNLFVALGLTRDAAADLSPDIVQLASDLASFNNIGVQEAIEKLRSGLVGEAEPLRALGVNLNEALVNAKALELGLVDSAGAVTEAGKVQARYALILEQTTTAQGDYARTADGIANTQRTLSAEFENTKTAVGEALLPAYQALLEIAPALIGAVESLTPVIAGVAAAAARAAPDIQTLAQIIQSATVVPGIFAAALRLAAGGADVLVGGLEQITTGAFTGEAGLNRMDRGLQNIGNTIDDLDVTKLEDSLIRALIAGRDPALALADALAQLGTLDLDPAALQAEAEALARISGIDASRMEDVVRLVRAEGEAAGFSALETQALIAGLRELNAVPAPPERAGSRGGAQREIEQNNQIAESALERAAAQTQAAREEATAARLFAETIGDEAGALELLGQAADDQNISITELLANTAALTPIQAQAADALSTASVKYLEQVDAINTLKTEVGILPGALSAAQEAMRDEEGQIVEDLDTFIANLHETLAAQEAFDFNIQLLRALDFGALADALEAGGPELARVAQEAVEDPIKAGIENARLEGTLKDSGGDMMDDILAGLEGKPITPALIDSLIAAAEAAQTPEVADAFRRVAEYLTTQMDVPVLIPVEPNFTDFQALLDAGILGMIKGSIPIPVVPTGGDGSGRRLPPRPSGDDAIGNEFGRLLINQNFYTEPAATTTTQRAAMEIAGIVSGTRF